MFDANFVKAIGDLAKASEQKPFLTRSGDPAHVIWVRQADGTYKQEDVPVGPNTCKCPDVQGFIAYADAHKVDNGPQSEILIDEEKAVFVFDVDEDRGDSCICEFTPTKQLLALRGFIDAAGEPQLLPQKSFVRLLRTVFRSGIPTAIASQFRKLDWESARSVSASADARKESMGSKIEKKVSGVGELPDEVVVGIPLFVNFPMLVEIRCAVEFDVDDQSMGLLPIGNEMENKMIEVLRAIETEISKNTDIPVYRGTLKNSVRN